MALTEEAATYVLIGSKVSVLLTLKMNACDVCLVGAWPGAPSQSLSSHSAQDAKQCLRCTCHNDKGAKKFSITVHAAYVKAGTTRMLSARVDTIASSFVGF
jgi:hypothetical protein